MVDLTDEENADWMARGREELTDEEYAEFRGDVVARQGRRFLLVGEGVTEGHDSDNPLPPDTEAWIFDAEDRTEYDLQKLGSILAHCPDFEPVNGDEADGDG